MPISIKIPVTATSIAPIPRWDFRPLALNDGEVASDPIQSEFFTTDSVGGLGQALVREAVQNALDARVDNQPLVRVRFCIVSVSENSYKQYFDQLEVHLVSGRSTNAGAVNLHGDLKFLIVEDFGTQGLQGDYSASSLVDNNVRNNFFYFWRNVGRSGKTNDNRGRWGLGKTVFPAASVINTFFGLTIPHKKPEKLLLGQAVLKTHRLENQDYAPYGFYGLFETGKHFATPVNDARLIADFSKVFQLKRVNESGLSIVIAIPQNEISEESIIRAAVQQYFYPILEGKLAITVGSQDIDSKSIMPIASKVSLDKDSHFHPQLFAETLRFADWAIHLPEQEVVNLGKPSSNAAPNWESHRNEIIAAREKFEENGHIAFNVPVNIVLESSKEADIAWFRVYIERGNDLSDAESHFIRDGISISSIKTLKQRGMRGLVVIGAGKLSGLLGDAENPAHTEWQRDSANFKGKYKQGPSILSFVKKSLPEIVQTLTEQSKDLDKNLLQDIFYVEPPPITESEGRGQIPNKRAGKRVVPPKLDIESKKRAVSISQIQGGIRITRNMNTAVLLSNVTVRFAYDVRGSDPFTRYLPEDFMLDQAPISVNWQGVSFQDMDLSKPNILEFIVQDEDFFVEVVGFDPNRDLKVKMTYKGSAE